MCQLIALNKSDEGLGHTRVDVSVEILTELTELTELTKLTEHRAPARAKAGADDLSRSGGWVNENRADI